MCNTVVVIQVLTIFNWIIRLWRSNTGKASSKIIFITIFDWTVKDKLSNAGSAISKIAWFFEVFFAQSNNFWLAKPIKNRFQQNKKIITWMMMIVVIIIIIINNQHLHGISTRLFLWCFFWDISAEFLPDHRCNIFSRSELCEGDPSEAWTSWLRHDPSFARVIRVSFKFLIFSFRTYL
jgi:hypothetical protein